VSAAIVGKPNVGKSSLLNALLDKDRAIVTDLPGTTRDIIEDYLNINGLPLRIMDTAGIRETHNLAEMEGVKRSLKAIDGADLIIAVLDASRPLDAADSELLEKIKNKKSVVVINKVDQESPAFLSPSDPRPLEPFPTVKVSAVTGQGIGVLKDAIYSLCIAPGSSFDREDLLITNMRHKHAIDSAVESLKKAEESLNNNEPLEVTALFLRETLNHLGTIIGVVTTDDILNRIFSEFCIGK
jgi:tRNA modification GTPase